MQFFSVAETVRNAQQNFYALNLQESRAHTGAQLPDLFIEQFDLTAAEADHTLHLVGSTFSPENESVYDGISRPGRRVVTFAPVLKHRVFPLAEILDFILEMGTWGMGTEVEIEFAVNMLVPPGQGQEFGFLQIRPMVLSREPEELKIGAVEKADLLCESNQVLGNGAFNDIHDIVVVDYHAFQRSRSHDAAAEVARLNAKLQEGRRPYVLIGVGRWGSKDPWLGIPVTWDQISGATAIVESGFKDINVAPSQGSHFFQNITSFRVGYFTVNSELDQGYIDWDWLAAQPASEQLTYTRHIHFDQPISIRINGHRSRGVILKPGAAKTI
jgi:hypothetical protein